ncbi:hypothetical protein D5S18_29220 [Nocardia panacis]|uniref:3-hydroxyacyl-CoA dehydrogenase n=1 Tax=Nocardia panacis TaxID=2340916 RepID=A0A3A4K676_9NOCA|nr:hypothetical protein [Nocardia panacis]RJO69960.1 hypothetical protein D5S18_29220 [Nocardia panacis]
MFDALVVLDIRNDAIVRIDPRAGSVTVAVADAGHFPDGLVYDPTADRLYWTTMGKPTSKGAVKDFSAPNGSIESVTLHSGTRETVLPEGALTTGKQLALNAGRLYWADREGCKVSTVEVGGGPVTDLIVNRPLGKMAQCVGIAITATDLYWTQKGPAKGGKGRILRAGREIPAGESAASRTDIETLWRDLPEPIDLWADLVNGYLYWTDRGAKPNGNTLNRAPIPARGESGAPPRILAGGFHEAIGLTVDIAEDTVYVCDLGGTVRAVAADGSSERVVARCDDRAFTGMAGIAG